MNTSELIDQLCFQLGKLNKIEELVKLGAVENIPPSKTLDEILAVVDSGRPLSQQVKYYLIEIQGVEPIIHGPHATEAGRDQQALRLRRVQDSNDLLFMADVDTAGSLTVEAYAGSGFFMEGEGDD